MNLVEIKVPAMGESIVEATIGTILKPSGSTVKAAEEILELETDKVNQVLYAQVAGRITLSVKQGDVVKVGQSIGSIEPGGAAVEPPKQPSEPKGSAQSHKKLDTPAPDKKVSAAETKPAPKPPASNHNARQTIDQSLSTQPQETASLAAPPPPKSTQKGEERKKMTKLRRTIAQRLVEVKNQTAMLTTFNEVDLSAIMRVREKEQENFVKRHGIKLGFMSFFIKASVAALQEYPEINARIEGDEIVYSRSYHISIAVSTDKGLMVPVIRNADQLGYAEIEKELKNFADKARNGTISIDDLQGGTFTITNGGVFGSLLSTPILNPPQSGILGMHNIVKRPIVIDDEIVIRPMMYLALSYDHRIVDGKQSIGFLVHIKKNLEDPARFLLDL